MSRSFRRTPIFGNANGSDKEGKVAANQRLRQRTRMAIKANSEELPMLREVSNVWTFPKDGKQYWRNAPAKSMVK